MNEREIQKIIDFINKRYEEEVPRPVKFVIRRKAKKLASLKIEEFPDELRRCTVEELLCAIKDAYQQKRLRF